MYSIRRKATNSLYWRSLKLPQDKLLLFRNIYNIITDFSEFIPNGTDGIKFLPKNFIGPLRLAFSSKGIPKGTNTGIAIPHQTKTMLINSFSLFYCNGTAVNTAEYYTGFDDSTRYSLDNPAHIAIAGVLKSKPTLFLADTLEGYLKLSNWFMNDLRVIENKKPTVVMYAHTHPENFSETLRSIYPQFGTVISFCEAEPYKKERFIGLPQTWLTGSRKRLPLFKAIKAALKD